MPDHTPSAASKSKHLGATEAVNEPLISRRDLPHPPRAKGGGPLPIGTQLGHFIVERYIGGGGMGRVYLARDTALDRRVAIKVLPQQWAHDKATVARFMNEARSAARLNHEHIAQVYFAHEYRGTPYIAFEYVEGTNIRDLVEAYGTFAIPQAINYIIQVTHALNHISIHGVVHRDVKPSNILITPQGNAKLIDMGLARLLGPSESQHDLTASGVTLGTFDYISPEQARDPRSVDIRSDIYSLGCTLFFMLTGRPPFPDGTVLQKLLQHQGDEPPSLHEFVPNAPPELVHIAAKMMAKDPRQRYQTPASLLDSLTHAAELIGLQPVGPGRSVWITRAPTSYSRWRFHLPWIVPTAALLVAAGAMLVVEHQGAFLIPDVVSHPTLSTNPALTPTPTINPVSNGSEGGNNSNNNSNNNGVSSSTGEPKPVLPLVRSVVLASDGTVSGETNSRGVWRLVPSAAGGTTAGGVAMAPSMGVARWGGTAITGGGIIRIASATTGSTSVTTPGGRVGLGNAASTAATATPPTLVVDTTATVPGSYATLASALSAAESGATIAVVGTEKPIAIPPLVFADKTIRIVAWTPPVTEQSTGDDVQRAVQRITPRLAFQAGDSAARAMLTIQSGSLTFEDVILEMDVPTVPAPWWSMVEMAGRGTLRCSRCVLLMQNPLSRHSDVAFVRSTASPLIDRSRERETPNTEVPSVVVMLQDTVVQGEATLLKWDMCRPVRVEATNSFIAVDTPLFSLEASSRVCKDNVVVTADLQFVTLVTRSPLWQQTQSSPSASLLPSRIQASGCIVVFASAGPLFDCYTAIDPTEAATSFRWVSERYPNFFQGLDSFGRIRKHALGSPLYQHLSLDDWQSRTSSPLRLNQVAWENPPPLDRSLTLLRAQDFALRQESSNPALRIDPDTPRDAGVNAAKLLGY